MANTRSSNVFYIDTQYAVGADELAIKNLKVKGVIVRTTGAGGRVVLSDSTTVKLDLQVAAANDTYHFDFSINPVLFNNSIRPTTLSSAIVSVIIEETRQ